MTDRTHITRPARSDTSSNEAIPSTGDGWPELEEKADGLVRALIKEEHLPGVSVSVTKEGRLLLSKGYGYALVDGKRRVPMKPHMRTKIGSVTKAAVTGPATWQLLKSKKIVPKTQQLYGPNGLFKGRFDEDIDIGIQKFAPESANWKGWYEKITLQNLFDHEAGFSNWPSSIEPSEEAAKTFNIPLEEVTYEHVHRYFLRTRPLKYEPGTSDLPFNERYANHGVGMLTVVIEQLSGKSYPAYVRENYLKPLKLHTDIRPERANPDSCDAWKHGRSNGELVPLDFGDSGLGLAAGGFMASTQALTRLMTHLSRTYTTEELDDMAWSKTSGQLSHGGRLGGGTAYAMMCPEGYTSSGGLDLGQVHVAVATNISMSDTGKRNALARDLALAVPASNVSESFDLWQRRRTSCEYSRHGVPAAEYQAVFEEAANAGYRLEWIDGYTDGGKVRFNLLFRTNEPAVDWVSHHGMTGSTYQKRFDQHQNAGLSLVHVDSYAVGNSVRYAAIWTKSGGAFKAYHGKNAADHQKSFDSLTKDGWRPKVVSVASVGGKRHYTALYTKQSIGKFEVRSFLTPAEYQTKFEENAAKGRHLRYLNSCVHKGAPRFAAIWAEKPEVSGYKAKHGLTSDEYRNQWQDALSADFRTRAITGYKDGNSIRFAAYWTK